MMSAVEKLTPQVLDQTSGQGLTGHKPLTISSNSYDYFPEDLDITRRLNELYSMSKDEQGRKEVEKKFGSLRIKFYAYFVGGGVSSILINAYYSSVSDEGICFPGDGGFAFFSDDPKRQMTWCSYEWTPNDNTNPNFIGRVRRSIDTALGDLCYKVPELKKQLGKAREKEIIAEMNGVKTSFVKIGCILLEMRQKYLYDTAQDFYEYVDGRFGLMSRISNSRCIE